MAHAAPGRREPFDLTQQELDAIRRINEQSPFYRESRQSNNNPFHIAPEILEYITREKKDYMAASEKAKAALEPRSVPTP